MSVIRRNKVSDILLARINSLSYEISHYCTTISICINYAKIKRVCKCQGYNSFHQTNPIKDKRKKKLVPVVCV
uniref:Uncharacterized protein n=1 Tax=Octopus bimaculoides TaxID=37653 RepID=A0A0L8GE62_OCTBM